jgi:hypothetical protein
MNQRNLVSTMELVVRYTLYTAAVLSVWKLLDACRSLHRELPKLYAMMTAHLLCTKSKPRRMIVAFLVARSSKH